MQIIDIHIESTSSTTAKCNAAVLKVNDIFRYIFIPKLVDNINDEKKCICGQFIIQKKSKNDDWKHHNNLKINNLKIGEWVNLDLSTSSMDNLLCYINDLKNLYLSEGKYKLFDSSRTFVFSDNIDSKEKLLILDLFDKDSQFKSEFKELLKSEVSFKDLIGMFNEKNVNYDENKSEVNNLYNVLKAKLINPLFLEDNLENTDEKFWQTLFNDNPNIISHIIPSLTYVIGDQPYMGGKIIHNKESNIGDFIYKSGSENSSIIEIKTPSTKLLSTSYRNNVYSPSKELSSSVVQIEKQKDGFLKEYNSIKINSQRKSVDFNAYNPKLYIIIGRNDDFSEDENESFELFRNGLKNVEVITFNELIDKLKILQKYLIGNSSDLVTE